MMGWGWNDGDWNGRGAWGLATDLHRGYKVPSALQILEERYARGDIDRQEFLAREHDLQS